MSLRAKDDTKTIFNNKKETNNNNKTKIKSTTKVDTV